MSSLFFGATESYSQPAGSGDQECLCYRVNSEPCEVLTPELDIPSSINQPEEMEDNRNDSNLAQNILSSTDAFPTQHQRVLRSSSKKSNNETPNTNEKPRNRSIFRSRKSQSRGSNKSRSRPRKSVSRSRTCRM